MFIINKISTQNHNKMMRTSLFFAVAALVTLTNAVSLDNAISLESGVNAVVQMKPRNKAANEKKVADRKAAGADELSRNREAGAEM